MSNTKTNASIQTKAALIFITLILIITIGRELTSSQQNMSLIRAGQIELGGENASILTTLRKLTQSNEDQSQQYLTEDDVAKYLPPSRNYRPRVPVLISRHEVTNLQYRRFINFASSRKNVLKLYTHSSIDKDHRFRPNSLNDVKYASFNQPIINVSWHDAYAFCRFSNMRLPSSYEFEQAFKHELSLRTPNELDYPQQLTQAGNKELSNTAPNAAAQPSPQSALEEEILPTIVGSYFTTNGIFQDIIGNAMEWVQPLPKGHLLMGYSYKQYGKDNQLKQFHPYKRHFANPTDTSNDYGFRCAYQPTKAQWQWLQSRPKTINRDGVTCWSTRNNLATSGLNLVTPHNKAYQASGQLFPNEMCAVPQHTSQLGPPESLTSIDLIRQLPLSYSNYILGDEPKNSFIKPFWLDQKEVTVSQFNEFLALPKIQQSLHKHPEAPKELLEQPPLNWEEQQQNSEQPIVGVNWYQAFAYCSWQDKRLPFANEWQAALKGSDNRLYPWGNNPKLNNRPDITPDKLYNMSKTTSEWSATFVLGSDSAIVKGGSELYNWQLFGRAYAQLKIARHSQSPHIGFRCAKSK